MSYPPLTRRSWLRIGSLFLLSTALLFLGFYRNQWNVVREKKFKEFQLDSESLVIARMVQSRQHGLLADNGLLGWGDANPLDLNASDYAHQYDVYLSGQSFETYSLYKSASGAQAMILGLLHQNSPFPPAVDLRNFRAAWALLLAAAVSLFVTWTFREFGLSTSIFVLATTILSQWITLYGRNLFYSIWASFLPLGLMLSFLTWEALAKRPAYRGLAVVGFTSILFKCIMNGYDFIIPALAMPAVPFAYYAIRDHWDRDRLLRASITLMLSMFAAVGVSLAMLAIQLQVSEGSFAGGIASILNTFGRRTYADPELFPAYAESLSASPWSVLWTYIYEDTAMGVLGLRFLDVLLIFAGITLLYTVFRMRAPQRLPDKVRSNSIIAATWLALLSPVSWFVLFKGQAYVHTHTNYLAWHMPFTLFGYAMCAWLLRSMGIGIGLFRKDAPPPGSSGAPPP
jgi:hypothetical protein